jgi:hypothetical protein
MRHPLVGQRHDGVSLLGANTLYERVEFSQLNRSGRRYRRPLGTPLHVLQRRP